MNILLKCRFKLAKGLLFMNCISALWPLKIMHIDKEN